MRPGSYVEMVWMWGVGGLLVLGVGWCVAEKIGELRKLLMTTVAGGSDWVPITDAEMNADGSDHGQAGDGTVARFKTDASGSWKGRIGGDGSVTEVIVWTPQ